MADTYRAAWEDLADRLDRAAVELARQVAEIHDARGEVSDARRLASKRAGVLLAKDYMRGYGLPTARYEPSAETPLAEDAT